MLAFVELNSTLCSDRGDSDFVSRVYTLVFIPFLCPLLIHRLIIDLSSLFLLLFCDKQRLLFR